MEMQGIIKLSHIQYELEFLCVAGPGYSFPCVSLQQHTLRLRVHARGQGPLLPICNKLSPWEPILMLRLKGKNIRAKSITYNLWSGSLLISIKNSKRSYFVLETIFFGNSENWPHFFQSV